MKPISVVIPTAREPEFLRCAIGSVARQSIVHDIEEVLVSENLGDLRSRAVCERFPQLPIRYVLQDPPLTPAQNHEYLIGQSRAPFIAFLCDDDWWGAGHLQAARSALTSDDDAVASFSACFYSVSDVLAQGWVSRSPAIWLAADKPDVTGLWRLTPDQVLAVCWLLTPFHMSSMVLRREPAVRALPAMARANSYTLDRLYFTELAAEGTILYEPLPDTFIRWRENNLTMRTQRADKESMFRECTAEIWRTSARRGVDLVGAWHRYLANAEPEVRKDIGACFRRIMDHRALITHGFGEFIPPSLSMRVLRGALRLGRVSIATAIGRRAS